MASPAEQFIPPGVDPAEVEKIQSERPTLKVIEGGKSDKVEDRWSPEEVLNRKPEIPKAKDQDEPASIDIAQVLRDDSDRVEQIRKNIELPAPQAHAPEQINPEEMQQILTKPNMPKPREHGAEAPVNLKDLLNPEPPTFKGELPAPQAHAPEQINPEEMQQILTKPNMPKPREHGAEAPVSISEIMNPTPVAPKFEGTLPVPPEQKTAEENIVSEDVDKAA